MNPALFALPLFVYFAFLLHMRWQWGRGLSTSEEARVPISLIIAYRNEEAHLPKLLASLEKQDFPKENLEIILIDDHSNDGGKAVLSNYSGPLRILLLSSEGAGKEHAILNGIRAARYPYLAFTDADCQPEPSFISGISAAFTAGHDWVGGLVAVKNPVSLPSIFDAYDQAAMMAISNAGYGINRPALASGAFMAFHRHKFEMSLPEPSKRLAGSDVRILKALSSQIQKPSFLRRKNALVFTNGVRSWKELFDQRKRWAGTAFRMNDPYILLLMVFGSYAQIFQIGGLLSLLFFWPDISNPLFVFVILKILMEGGVVHATLQTSQTDRRFLFRFPAVAFLYPFYLFCASFLGIFTQSNWKNRKTA